MTQRSEAIELTRRLFAVATARLESAHTSATQGQADQLTHRAYRDFADQVRTAATDVVCLMAAASVVHKDARWAIGDEAHDEAD